MFQLQRTDKRPWLVLGAVFFVVLVLGLLVAQMAGKPDDHAGVKLHTIVTSKPIIPCFEADFTKASTHVCTQRASDGNLTPYIWPNSKPWPRSGKVKIIAVEVPGQQFQTILQMKAL